MSFQETFQHFPPPVMEHLQAFWEALQQRLSPTDWERLQTFLEGMPPDQQRGMMEFIAQRESHAPAVGAMAPDFALPRLGSDERVQLSAYRNDRAVALIFGSFT